MTLKPTSLFGIVIVLKSKQKYTSLSKYCNDIHITINTTYPEKWGTLYAEKILSSTGNSFFKNYQKLKSM